METLTIGRAVGLLFLLICVSLLTSKARVRVDFRYHSPMGTIEEFRDLWCFTSAEWSVQGGKLFFNSV
ncbi:unnamed protein product [Boreogadus saida]